jgi:hypothetical protein
VVSLTLSVTDRAGFRLGIHNLSVLAMANRMCLPHFGKNCLMPAVDAAASDVISMNVSRMQLANTWDQVCNSSPSLRCCRLCFNTVRLPFQHAGQPYKNIHDAPKPVLKLLQCCWPGCKPRCSTRLIHWPACVPITGWCISNCSFQGVMHTERKAGTLNHTETVLCVASGKTMCKGLVCICCKRKRQLRWMRWWTTRKPPPCNGS